MRSTLVRSLTFVILGTLAFAAPCKAQTVDSAARRADSLTSLHPVAEAQHAIRRHDFRLVGVCGYYCGPVGLFRSDSLCFLSDVRYIAGTSDAVSTESEARLNRVAADYARRYNRVLIAFLGHVPRFKRPGPGLQCWPPN
jgi:hypothetical protein